MTDTRRAFLRLAAGSAALVAVPEIATALDYPTRPVRVIVGLAAGGPLPAQDQAFGLDDFDILAGALVFGAVEHAEAHPESAPDAHIRLGKEYRAGVRSPPLRDAIWHGQRLEDDRWPRADSAHEGKTGHRPFFLASASLLSAYAARRSRRLDQKRS